MDNSFYWNADMSYDAVKEAVRDKIGDRFKIKLTVDNKESVFDMTEVAHGILVDILTDTLTEIVKRKGDKWTD